MPERTLSLLFRPTRAAAALLALAPLAGCEMIESPTYCGAGVLPFDGATAVPLDATVSLDLAVYPDERLPELPPLDNGLVVWNEETGRVALDFAVHGDVVEAIPREPLQPDTDYTVEGILWEDLRGYGSHWWAVETYGTTSASFTTRSDPQVIGAFRYPEESRIVVVFSEPVDPQTVSGALELTWGDRSTATAVVLGPYLDNASWIDVVLDDWPIDQRPAVALSEGVVATSGVPMVIPPHTPVPTLQPEELGRLGGLDTCEVVP